MTNYLNIKQQLFKICIQFIENKHAIISKSIASNKNDLFSETKSSAGDKHETGRAMIQLEMEKSGQQLVEVQIMQAVLSKINIEKKSKVVCLGSLVRTTKGTYFLTISVGKITVEKVDYFVVSAQSPIGKQLLGKTRGVLVPFNGAEILEVV